MKTVLAFETSSPVLSVALGTADGGVRELRASQPLQHSENLIPLIDRLLRGASLRLKDVSAFAIDRGPGSFTGLRIGLSLVKGFLAAQKKPCYGALSLDMIAAKIALPEGSRLAVVIDARREAWYSRIYQSKKGEWVAEGKPELLSWPELKARLRKKTSLAGDGLLRVRGSLEQSFGKQISLLPATPVPSAATLVRWFQTKNPRLVLLKSPRDFLPLYFRASEAEEKRTERIRYGT